MKAALLAVLVLVFAIGALAGGPSKSAISRRFEYLDIDTQYIRSITRQERDYIMKTTGEQMPYLSWNGDLVGKASNIAFQCTDYRRSSPDWRHMGDYAVVSMTRQFPKGVEYPKSYQVQPAELQDGLYYTLKTPCNNKMMTAMKSNSVTQIGCSAVWCKNSASTHVNFVCAFNRNPCSSSLKFW